MSAPPRLPAPAGGKPSALHRRPQPPISRSPQPTAATATLTRRELEILRLIARGLNSQAIARRLSISVRTERNHVASILAKLGVHSRLEALVTCLRAGVIKLD